MKEIEIFYLDGCPYCKNARKAIEQLTEEEPAYGQLPLRWIDESRERALADSRDYYYVPTFYYAGEKLYECSPRDDYSAIREKIRAVFDRAMQSDRA